MVKHFLTINDLTKDEINKVLTKAKTVEQQWEFCQPINNKCIASFFGEPSTRTRFSFERAMQWLGGRVISAADASVSSSLKKGESLKDTFRTLGQYADCIVMRYNDENWVEEARNYSRVPVINAGSGCGEHPTQALLDLHTIKQKFTNTENLKVMICGDLLNGRTVHSLVNLLSLYGCEITLCASRAVRKDVKVELNLPEKYNELKLNKVEIEDADDVLSKMDVIYMTRVQKERPVFPKLSGNKIIAFRCPWPANQYDTELFQINKDNINKIKPSAIILHPLPRMEEITQDIDEDPRAEYHEKQVRNGVYVRVALLDYLIYRN